MMKNKYKTATEVIMNEPPVMSKLTTLHNDRYLIASPITWGKLKIKSSCLVPDNIIYLMNKEQYRVFMRIEKIYDRQLKKWMREKGITNLYCEPRLSRKLAEFLREKNAKP